MIESTNITDQAVINQNKQYSPVTTTNRQTTIQNFFDILERMVIINKGYIDQVKKQSNIRILVMNPHSFRLTNKEKNKYDDILMPRKKYRQIDIKQN